MNDLEKKFFEFVEKAISEVYRKDKYLIENETVIDYSNCYSEDSSDEKNNEFNYVSERAIVFRFAHYLQNIINDDPDCTFVNYNLDCEYNRNIKNVKCLPHSLNRFIPDVILHKRGSNKDNFAVMEFKVWWSKEKNDYDISKVEELTSVGNGYDYKCGFVIRFNQKLDSVEINVYRDGKIVENNEVIV